MRLFKTLAAIALATALFVIPAATNVAAATPTVSVHGAALIAAPRSETLKFPVTLSAASASPVTVLYTTADGTAVAGTDYTAASGTLTIPASSTRAVIAVKILSVAFTSGAPDKTFTMNLSSPSGATLGAGTANGVIHPDPYVAARPGSLQDAVIDPSSRTAYITNFTSNDVEVLNIGTGSYSAPIPVGSQPIGIDITPDGKTLYVCDSGGQTISVVDVASRKVVKTIITPPGFDSERAFTIAIGNNGHALFTTTFNGSGFGAHVYDLNLSTDAISVFTPGGINGQVTELSPVFRSADYSTIGGLLGDDSGGPFFVYHISGNTTVSGSLNNFIQWGGLSGNGKVLLIDPSAFAFNASTYVVDTSTGAQTGTIPGASSGVVVNGNGTFGHRLEPGDVGTLNVTRFLETGTIPAPDASNPGNMAGSPNGLALVAITSSGVTIVRL